MALRRSRSKSRSSRSSSKQIRQGTPRHMFLLIVVFQGFFLPFIFLDLLVARSVSWQETLYMYKYISTYTASLDKNCFFLLLGTYGASWQDTCFFLCLFCYVFFLLSLARHTFYVQVHINLRSVSWQETLLSVALSICMLGTYGASWQDTCFFSLLFFMCSFFLPSF